MASNGGILDNIRYLRDKISTRLTLFTGGFLPYQPHIRTDLTGKNIVITGSNSGLGYQLALTLASMNANIFMACRNAQKADDARLSILKEHSEANIAVLILDSASLQSVRDFATKWTFGPIHALLNNSGIASVSKGKDFTKDGFETMYQTNMLSQFLLTHLLEPNLAPDARVIITSSMGAYGGIISDNFARTQTKNRIEPGFHTLDDNASVKVESNLYFQSKLMQAAFARLLQQRFDRDPENQRLAFAWEPGVVKTNIHAGLEDVSRSQDFAYWLVNWCAVNTGISVQQGAATGVYVTVSEEEQVVGKQGRGKYWSRCGTRLSSADFFGQEKLDRLWTRWSADAGISWN